MFRGDEEIRTPDPLLARQVLSQLSYTPVYPKKALLPLLLVRSLGLAVSSAQISLLLISTGSGLKWTRTTDLTLIRRAL